MRDCKIGKDDRSDLLQLTHSKAAKERARAIRQLCPCRIKQHDQAVWDRVFELAKDEAAVVRRHVLHLLADGSPRVLEERVVAAIEGMQLDDDKKIRRQARHLMAHYRKGGSINIL